MKKNKFIESISKILKKDLDNSVVDKITEFAHKRYFELCNENNSQTKYVKEHTFKKIYPAISLFEGMVNSGYSRDESIKLLDKSFSIDAEKEAKSIRGLLKIPFLYKTMPGIFKKVTVKSFGEKAGFKATFYNKGKKRCKFDMTKCLYYEELKRYGYSDLTICFCHTDDVKDGNMHKKLKWNRTKTIGEGADVCDFDLFIDE